MANNDDTKSTHSGISNVSKFTQNLLNKSKDGIQDQWYQFIYNDDPALDDGSAISSKSNNSRFTLKSGKSRQNDFKTAFNTQMNKRARSHLDPTQKLGLML
jgi:hypothetical protein